MGSLNATSVHKKKKPLESKKHPSTFHVFLDSKLGQAVSMGTWGLEEHRHWSRFRGGPPASASQAEACSRPPGLAFASAGCKLLGYPDAPYS